MNYPTIFKLNYFKQNLKASLKDGFLFSFYLTLIVFLLSPFLIISSNTDEFNIHDLSVFFLSLITTWSITFILVLVPIILLGILGKLFRAAIFSFIVIITLFSLYLPLGQGVLDGAGNISISFTNLLIGLLVGSLSFLVFSYRNVIFPILIIGPLMLSSGAVFNIFSSVHSASVIPASKDKENIFVISFDTLEVELVKSAIDSLPQSEKENFDGFVFYNDVLGISPITKLSTLMTKLGQLPKNESYHELLKEQITTKLDQNGYSIETFYNFSQHEEESTNILSPFLGLPETNYFIALESSFLRFWPFQDHFSKSAKNTLSKTANRLIGTKNYSPEFDNLHIFNKQIASFDEFIDQLDVGNENPTFRMHHYVFTHIPFIFSSECKFNTGKKASALSEAKCATSKMIAFIKKLKKLNIHQNSAIFFQADHGLGCNQADRNFLASSNQRISQFWCAGRYSPFLMVKFPLSNNPLVFSKTPVSSFDIPQTICSLAIKNKEECSVYQGYNLLSKEPPLSSQFRPILQQKPGIKHAVSYSYKDYFSKRVDRHITLKELFKLPEEPEPLELSAHQLPTKLPDASETQNGGRLAKGEKAGYVTFGPYLDFPEGNYEFNVKYRYKPGSDHSSNEVSYWDINSQGGLVYHSQPFSNNSNVFTWDRVVVTTTKLLKNVELRTFYNGDGELEVERIKIRVLPFSDICSERVQFGKKNATQYYRSNTLSTIESWGRWSDGDLAEIQFSITPDCEPKFIVFNLKAYTPPNHPPPSAHVYVNGKPVTEIRVTSEDQKPKQFTFALPESSDGNYTVRFEIDSPVSPISLGGSDTRELGFGFIDMKLLPDEAAAQ